MQEKRKDETGGAILELLFLVIILPIFLLPVALGIVIGFEVVHVTVSSTIESSGAQALAAQLQNDTSTATEVTTGAGQPQCGTGTQVLGLAWAPNGSGPQDVVSYSVTQANIAGPFAKSTTPMRNFCTNGFAATPVSSEIVVSYPNAATITATVTPSGAASNWVASTQVSGVEVTESSPQTSWPVVLYATPGLDVNNIGAP